MTGDVILPGALRRIADINGHAAVYFVGDEAKGYTIIDPSVYVPDIKVRRLLLTHAHYDHFIEMSRYREQAISLFIPEAEVWTLASADRNGSRLFMRPVVPEPAEFTVADGDVLEVNDRLELLVISTPGHTRGGACYLLREKADQRPLALLSGDTLIPGSMGRTDLAGGDDHLMRQSLKKIKDLLITVPPDLPIGAGHASMTTAARELTYNPYLNAV